jgi:DNA-directed RNA polymerase specialized sigma subunit
MGQHLARISHPPSAPADARRAENRRRLREFLRATPREEAESRVELLGLVEGASAVVVTRGWLTAAIEELRPQPRQVIRLTLEERRTRREVQAYLHGISVRTMEREQAAGLDELMDRAMGR